jgi:hypothetical protein
MMACGSGDSCDGSEMYGLLLLLLLLLLLYQLLTHTGTQHTTSNNGNVA